MRVAALRDLLLITLLSASSLLNALPLSAASAGEYRALGLRYRQQERLPEAIAALQKSVELDPKNLSGHVLLGWTLHLAGQDRESASVLQQVLSDDPYHVPALNALGIIYLFNDDLAAAVLTHSWAATLEPNNEVAHYNLSLAFQRLGQYDWAIDSAQKAASLEPDNPHPLVALAIAHWSNRETAIAQQVYQKAIQLDARYRDRDYLNNLQQSGFNAAQIEESKQVLENIFP